MYDKRLRSSIKIDVHGKTLVIDTGPDFRQQMLRENVTNVDAILFTHEHKDHIAGLDDIRSYNYLNQIPMDVYAEERVYEALKREFAYIFAEKKYPGIPQVNFHIISENEFDLMGIHIVPIRVMHYHLPILGFRIHDFTYITDANFISKDEIQKIKGTKHLILTGLRKQKHISHFALSESLKLIEELNPERGYITHISHQLGLHKEIQNELPSNVILAYDGLKIEC